MAELSPFELRLGTGQGRIRPAHGAPASGSYAFVLGDDDELRLAKFAAGDYAQVVQDVDLTGLDFVRAVLGFRAPAEAPTGTEWRVAMVIDGAELVSARCRAGRSRTLTDLVGNGSKLSGVHTIGVRLALGALPGGPGSEPPQTAPPDDPMPALYVDDVVAVDHDAQLALVNRDPGPSELGVPIDWTIAFELIDTGLAGVSLVGTTVWVNGVKAYDGDSGGFQAGFDGPDSAVSAPAADTLRIVLDPTAPFTSEQLVTVRVQSELVGGGSPLDESYSFTTEDVQAPQLVMVGRPAVALDQRTVRLEFDEDVVVADASAIILTPRTFPAVPLVVVEAQADGHFVVVTVDTEMTPGANYQIDVSNGAVEDTDGNPTDPFEWVSFDGFRPEAPYNRRFLLWYMLPQKNRDDDETGDLRRFIDCLQEVVDLLLFDIDRFPEIFDIERCSSTFIDLILADLGDPFDVDLEDADKRRLATVLVQMYREKGTAEGIENAIRFFLGIEVEVQALNDLVMRLGVSRLGDNWTLGTTHQRSLYSFDIVTDAVLTAELVAHVRRIAEYLKPAHTHLVDVRGNEEPTVPVWVLGQSQLGADSTLS